jgi:hypothetical protein
MPGPAWVSDIRHDGGSARGVTFQFDASSDASVVFFVASKMKAVRAANIERGGALIETRGRQSCVIRVTDWVRARGMADISCDRALLHGDAFRAGP